MTTRTVEAYTNLLRGKNQYEIAKQIIEDLVGYRANSSSRVDDTTNVRNAIKAIMVLNDAPESKTEI